MSAGQDLIDMVQAQDTLKRALKVMVDAHAGQMRKGLDEDYAQHPLRVARMAVAAGFGVDVVTAALLHDVLEDTPTTLADLDEFSPRAVQLVRLLSKWWPDDAPTEVKRREKPVYYRQIAADSDATHLKLLDRADNLRDMRRMVERDRRWQKWAARYLQKTVEEVHPLMDHATHPGVVTGYLHEYLSLEVTLRLV